MKNEPIEATPTQASEAGASSSPTPPNTQKKSPSRKRTAQPPRARPGTKKAAILALLKRPQGATLKELRKATQWQAHSVRGFLSGVVAKHMGLKVRVMNRDGERAYQLKS